jgi:hypothetical protein
LIYTHSRAEIETRREKSIPLEQNLNTRKSAWQVNWLLLFKFVVVKKTHALGSGVFLLIFREQGFFYFQLAALNAGRVCAREHFSLFCIFRIEFAANLAGSLVTAAALLILYSRE